VDQDDAQGRGIVVLIALSLSFASATAWACPAAQQEPPAKREIKKLVEEWWPLDPRDPAGFAREQAILAQLELVPLSATLEKTWRKDLAKLQDREARKLPNKSGRHYYWEDEKLGQYLIGGKTKKPKGLLIGMHGGGLGSGDPNGMHSEMSSVASALDFVSICPGVLEKTEHGWTDSGTEEWVLDLVDAAIRSWEIDPARVYFSGHSMGGYGSWTLGAHHADRVAGLGPSAGAPSPIFNFDEEIIDVAAGVIPNLRNVPMLVYQSTDDVQVPPNVNQAAVKLVAAAKERWGGYEQFRYWEVSGRGHSFAEGGMLAVVEPLTEFVRNPIPERIVWQPSLDWKHQFYWLWWEQPTFETILIADLDREANAVRLQCDKPIDGLRILLDERVLDLDKEVVVYLNDEIVCRGMVTPTLGDLLRTAKSPDTGLHFHASLKVGSPPAQAVTEGE
jgi:poly(3-hydroxybutyrate) depolymerase